MTEQGLTEVLRVQVSGLSLSCGQDTCSEAEILSLFNKHREEMTVRMTKESFLCFTSNNTAANQLHGAPGNLNLRVGNEDEIQ